MLCKNVEVNCVESSIQRLKTQGYMVISGDRRCNNASRLFLRSWHILSLLQDSSFEDRCDGYLTLAEYVQDFLNHLTEQPGCFETEIEQFAETLNGWVIADEALQELVELIYQQVMYYKMDIMPLLPSVQDRHSSICYITVSM